MSDSGYSQVPTPMRPVAVPHRPGPSALKTILIFVAILIGLGMIEAGILAYGIYEVAKGAHRDADRAITIPLPEGSITDGTNQTFTASDLGIAIYPRATQQFGGMRMTVAGKSMVTVKILTHDSPDKVMEFYKDQAGPNAQIMTSGSGGLITMKGATNSVTVNITQSASENGGQTQITIVNTTGVSN